MRVAVTIARFAKSRASESERRDARDEKCLFHNVSIVVRCA
jgi:hypothetical protein